MRLSRAYLLLPAAALLAALIAVPACRPGNVTVATTAGNEQRPADPDLQGPDLYDDVTKASGIDFAYRNGEEVDPPHLAILESLGGGAALIDYDGDGLPDVYLPGGGYFDGPDRKQIRGHAGRLYRNLGGFKFKDVTKEAGLDALAGGQPWFYSHGAAVGDHDRDGRPDLLVTGWGRVALFHNEPDGQGGRKFVDVSAAAGLDQGITWATSAAWADLDGDGWPDLYVCQYVDWSFANHPTDCNYDGKTRDVCPPKKFAGLVHKLYRNERGRFKDVSESAGLLKGGPHQGKGLGVLAVDLDLDGKPEIYVANDTVANFLYHNKSAPGRIELKEEGALSSTAYDGSGGPNGSMGLDAGDPDGTGRPFLWVTNYENELHALYKNHPSDKGHLRFVYYSQAAGVGAIGQKFVGWGTGFMDVERRGWEDLFIANGHAIRYPTGTTRRQRPVLLRNRQGKFKDITPRGGSYFRTEHLARGAVLGDLDNDGRVDLVVTHMNEPAAVLRNVSPDTHHWLGVELAGKDHADPVGARVVLEAGGRKQTRFAKGGGSYASSPDRRFVFGLGTADKVDKLTVFWPDGSQQSWAGLAIDRYHVLAQGEKEPRQPPRKP